jgi:hypothetical protein
MDPVHLDNDLPTLRVEKDENKMDTTIIAAPANAKGRYASGFNIPLGYSGVALKKIK